MKNDGFDNMKTTSTISTGFRDADQDGDQGGRTSTKNSPEIENPKPSDASKIFPDEVPRRDGPGGE
jgi:hypothetical protein